MIEEAPSEEAIMEFGACLFPPSHGFAGPWSKLLATPCGRQGQVVLACVEYVESNDEE